MAAARRRTCEGKRSKPMHSIPAPSRLLRLSNAHPRVCLAPQLTWSRRRDPDRSRITAQRSVLLLLLPRFLACCLLLGVPVPSRGPRDSAAQALSSFRAADALRLVKGNFHWARSSAPRSAEPSTPGSGSVSCAFSGSQLPPSLRGAKPAGGGWRGEGAYTGPSSRQSGSASLALGLRAPNLPISLVVVDGAQRDPAAAAAAAAAAASSITQRMPQRALPEVPDAPQPRTGPEGSYTHSSRQRNRGLATLLCPPRPRHQLLLAKEESGQRKPPPPRESGAREDAATRLPLRRGAATLSGRPLRGSCQATPGWCASPSVAAAPPLRRAALLLGASRARPPRNARSGCRRRGRRLRGWRCGAGFTAALLGPPFARRKG